MITPLPPTPTPTPPHPTLASHNHIKADCIWMRDMLLEAKSNIQKYIVKPVSDFKAIFKSRAEEPFEELFAMMDDADKMVETGNANDSFISVRNATVWQTYSALVSTLSRLVDPLVVDLGNLVDSLPTMGNFVLDGDLLGPILPNVGASCDWCYPNNPEPLLQILKDKVYDKLGDWRLLNKIRNAKDILDEMYVPFLLNLYITDYSGNVKPNERQQYEWNFGNASNQLDVADGRIQDALSYTEETLELVDSLLDYAWGYKCQTELPKLINEYRGNHNISLALMDEVDHYILDQDNGITDLWNRYTLYNITLEQAGGSIAYDEIIRIISAKKLRLHSILNDRILLVNNLERQINQVYYVIMSLAQTDYIADKSAYWEEFGITDPGIDKPSTCTIGDVDVPLPDFGMVPNGNATDHWRHLVDMLGFIRASMETQVEDLATAVSTTKTYAVDYINGNRINEDFYR